MASILSRRAEPATLLEISDVHQSFRSGFWLKRAPVLKGVSLEVPEKSIYGFLGANGAGKTTLIHLIAGLKRPTSGQVRLRGLDTSLAATRARIGYLPERPYFHEHLTGEGLLKYFGALSGMGGRALRDRISRVLSIVGMGHARKLELRRYSKGMLQRIGIGQAILHDPELLVLDEPMSGLDPVGRREIRELILELASEGRTIFFSSHVIPDIEAICDHVALIQKGGLIGAGPIGQFLSHGPLETEIAFSGVGAQEVERLGFASVRQTPEGFRGSVSGQEEIARLLRELVGIRARVHWMSPVRSPLEGFFEAPR